MDSDAAISALLNALLWGQLNGVDPNQIQLLSRTGLIHLLSASGTHMLAFLALAKLVKLCWPKRMGPWIEVMVLLGGSLIFALAGGGSSPFLRAWALVALVKLSRFGERNIPSFPLALGSCGFAALAGSSSWISLTLSIAGALSFLWAKPPYRLAKAMLAPWIFTAPFCIFFFGQFSWTAPLWNLLFGTLMTVTLLPLALLNLVAQKLGWNIFVSPTHWWAAFLMETLARMEQLWPWSTAVAVPFSLFALSLTILIAIRASSGAVALVTILLLALAPEIPRPLLALLNVGQGDSIFFINEENERILLDTGPRSGRKTVWQLQKRGISQIDYVLLSHLDQDHRGGLEGLLQYLVPRKAIVLTDFSLTEERAHKVLELAELHGIPIRLWQELPWNCWFSEAEKANDSSPICIFSLRNGENLFVSGDASQKIEAQWLASAPNQESVTYFKLGHHGSKYSNSDALIETLNPEIAIVGVGRNSYGHPHLEVLQRIREKKIPLYRADGTAFNVWW
jgi:competence protein ComEC